MRFVCVECGCTKSCVPIDGPNGVTCDVCYGVIQEKQTPVAKAVEQVKVNDEGLGFDYQAAVYKFRQAFPPKFYCPVCSAVCSTPMDAGAHCPPIRPYQCRHCGFSASLPRDLVHHMAVYHP